MLTFRTPGEATLLSLTSALSDALGAAAESAVTLDRTFLDSVDWRLFKCGYTLEAVRQGRQMTLSLSRTHTGKSLHVARIERMPRFPSELPVGPLRARLDSLLDVRALLSVVEVRTQRARVRVFNTDDKTVFRVVLNDNRLGRRKALVTRLCPLPVRGYEKMARRCHDALSAKLKLLPVEEPLYHEAHR